MFKRQKSQLDRLIDEQISDLKDATAGSDEAVKITNQLTRLYELKSAETKTRVSPDTWALVGANLVGIGIIVGYEHAHVITSKAIGLLNKTAV